MNQYELTFLMKPDLEKKVMTKLVKDLETQVKKAKGSVVTKEDWGKKILAYPIAGASEAYYYYLAFHGPADLPKKLSDFFQTNNEVIRDLIVKKEKKS